jgi:drug/metabolite transporter (DMT)-like permease
MLYAPRSRLIGIALVLLSAFAWSLNGLYTRFLTTDVFTTLAGRGIATSTMLAVAILLIRGRTAWPILRFNAQRGAAVVICGSFCMIAFVAALFNTTVANVTVIYAVSPVMAAVLAWFMIGDKLVIRTLLAFAVATVGIAIMVQASFGTERLFGDFLALLMSATFAIVIVEMRRKPDIDNLATSLLTSVLTVLVLAPFASFEAITARDALVLFLFGVTSNVLGFFAFIAGVRRMPPAEAGLIATIEIVLAPLWVWLLFAEDPGAAAMLGGAIVLAAVVLHIMGGMRSERGVRQTDALSRAAGVQNSDGYG